MTAKERGTSVGVTTTGELKPALSGGVSGEATDPANGDFIGFVQVLTNHANNLGAPTCPALTGCSLYLRVRSSGDAGSAGVM